MEVTTLMHRLGGSATSRQLLARMGRRQVDTAVADGTILRLGRGRYVLPTASEGEQAAARLKGVAGLRTAAASWGWALKSQPDRPEIIVPRGRKVPAAHQQACAVRWRRLEAHDVAGWRTAPIRTVTDCATTFPFDEALAIADSALRAGSVTSWDLSSAADALPGRGRERALDIAWYASDLSAGPFESVVRAISIEHVPGARLVPQVRLTVGGRRIRPDLVDRELRLVVEADSHEFHTSRARIDGDCRRYDELLLDDWLVLRFSWVQAMFEQDWVASVLNRGVYRQARILGTRIAEMRAHGRGRPLPVPTDDRWSRG
ncbi:hypothetical protein [Intrasporangium sp.]|uniref:hypothetical protein n=1 Tax=Intrasporangium sp. TaxID=1925024 RepID=UPI003221B079